MSIIPFPNRYRTDALPDSTDEPTAADLAAIDTEWPLIAAEVDLVDAEIRVLTAEPHRSELDWRRLRRAEARVAREARTLAATGTYPIGWAA